MTNWTPERKALCLSLWSDGVSATTIAAQLGGVTRNAVIGKVHRAGAPKKRQAYLRTTAALIAPPVRPRRPQATGGGIGANLARGVGKAFAKLNPPKIVAALPPKPLTEPTRRPITLMKLQPQSCRWPVKEETGVRQLFCGATTEIGVPYCEFHTKRSRGHSAPEWTPERHAKVVKSMGLGSAVIG
jgi:GcrA cell cycle regulator